MTLAEVLVALAVSMGIVLTAGRLLLLANGAYAAQAEAAGIEDGGRFAVDLMSRAVRQAGALDVDAFAGPDTEAAPARLAGLDARTLARNPRMAMPYRNWDRMKEEDRVATRKQAARFLDALR